MKEWQDKVYVIGDSHVSFFSSVYLDQYIYKEGIGICRPHINPFRTFHLGAALAYNLNKYGTTTRARENIEFLFNTNIIPKGAKILCAFGEIDMRVHVFKETAKRNIDFKQVVDEIVAEYFAFIESVSKDYEVYIWCPVASQSDNCGIDPNFPRIGTQIERNKATEYFGNRITELCSELPGVKCLSIFSFLIDEEYRTKLEFYRDPVHLSQKAWIFAKDEFERVGIVCEKI